MHEPKTMKIAMFADPGQDRFMSLSWHVKTSLEDLGHIVFYFHYDLTPWAFLERGVVDCVACDKFFDNQSIDRVLLSDGIKMSGRESISIDEILHPSYVLELELFSRYRLANDIVDEGEALSNESVTTIRASSGERAQGPIKLRKMLESYFGFVAQPKDRAKREIVTVLGYFGWGNFGDEYVLSILEERLRDSNGLCAVVVLCENPSQVFAERGIFALPLDRYRAIDDSLAESCVLLVTAGLLFDQGIRWTMGKADILAPSMHTDLPSIAQITELAWLNGTQTVFFGIGAGPLDLVDSRRLVSFMGKLDAIFYSRDEDTLDLLLSCGVSAKQVHSGTDIAFLRNPKVVKAVDVSKRFFGGCSKRYICVCLRNYDNVTDEFVLRVAGALDLLLAHDVSLCALFCALDPSDVSVSGNVISKMKQAARTMVYDPKGDIDELEAVLMGSYFGLSMRYHSALVMSRSGIPSVGLGYLPKVEALYEELGCRKLLLSMDASKDKLESALLDMSEHREEYSRRMTDASSRMKEKAEVVFRELTEIIHRSNLRKREAVLTKEVKDIYPNDTPSGILLSRNQVSASIANTTDVAEGRLVHAEAEERVNGFGVCRIRDFAARMARNIFRDR